MTTKTERPAALPALPALTIDTDALSEGVDAELSRHKGLWEKVEAAEKIIAADKALFDTAGRYRDALMLSLVLYDGYSALAVSKAGGVSRALLGKMLDERVGSPTVTPGGKRVKKLHLTGMSEQERTATARKRKIVKHASAAAELPWYAKQVAESRARADRARVVRDEAIRQLLASDESVTQASVAARLGWNPSNVAHIMRAGREDGPAAVA